MTPHLRPPGATFSFRTGVSGRGADRFGARGRPGDFGRGFRFGPRRFGRGYGGGYGLGDVGLGLGLDQVSGVPLPPFGGGYGEDAPYPPEIGAAAPPPCPMIISIGRGLRRQVPTRVVYGSRPACAR